MGKQKRRRLQEDMSSGQAFRGWSDEQMAEANDALAYFDDSYNAVEDRVDELGGGQPEHKAYHGTVKRITGKARPEVDIWESKETRAWGDGYTHSHRYMEDYRSIDVDSAADAAWEGFAGAGDDDEF